MYSAMGTVTAATTLAPSACVDPSLQGKTSSCAAVASRAVGQLFSLSANGVGPVVGLQICFYSSSLVELGCVESEGAALSSTVPQGATRMAITADSGVAMSWYFRAG